MVIKKSSWHYWLLSKVNHSILWDIECGYSVTLCRYFWAVVLSIFVVAGCGLFIGMALFVLLSLVYGVISMIALLLFPYIGYFDIIAYDLGIVFLVFALFGGSVGGLIAWLTGEIKFAPNYIKQPLYKLFNKAAVAVEESNIKAPSLLVEAYKAHKEKFCPIVTLEN